MVLAGAGGVNHEELCDLATKHFGKITDKYDAEVPLDLAMRYTGKFNQGPLITDGRNSDELLNFKQGLW